MTRLNILDFIPDDHCSHNPDQDKAVTRDKEIAE